MRAKSCLEELSGTPLGKGKTHDHGGSYFCGHLQIIRSVSKKRKYTTRAKILTLKAENVLCVEGTGIASNSRTFPKAHGLMFFCLRHTMTSLVLSLDFLSLTSRFNDSACT